MAVTDRGGGFTDVEVRAAAESYNIGKVTQIRRCQQGRVNANFHVVTSSGEQYLLRRYARGRVVEEIEFELSTLLYLSQRGLPVQRPIRRLDGSTMVRVRGRVCVLLTYLPGRALRQDELSPSLSEQIGHVYGAIEAALDGFEPCGRKPSADYALVDRLVREEVSLRECGAGSVLRETWSVVTPFAQSLAAESVVHGDLYHENIIVTNGLKVVGVVDFDDAFFGSRVLDLALVLMEFSVRSEPQLDMRLITPLLSAYMRVTRSAPPSVDSLQLGMLFQCCKFYCYTRRLERSGGTVVTDNAYLRRLTWLLREENVNSVRRALNEAFTY